MMYRFPKMILRSLVALFIASSFVACQSDEEKLGDFLDKGLAYEVEDKHQEAVIEFKNVLKIDPNHADAHYQLAKAYMELGRARDAYWEMSETVRLDPSNTEAALSFGALSLVAGDPEQALAMGKLAMEGEPDNHQGYILAGRALEKLKRELEAEEFFLKAVELETQSFDTILTLAAYYAQLPDGRVKAEPWFWKGLERFPNFRARTAVAKFLVQDPNRADEAEVMFKEAIASMSEGEIRDEGYTNLARFYFQYDRPEEAVAILRQAVDVVEDPTDMYFMLATYYRVSGDEAESESLIRQAAAVNASNPAPFLVLSSFLGGREDLEGALEAAELARAADPENVDAQLRRAEILIDMGFRESTEEYKSKPDASLSAIAQSNAKIAEGLALVEVILADAPFHPQGEFVRARAYLAKGDSDAGIAGFRAAAEGRPDWAEAHFALGSALASVNESSLARVEIARALELNPGMHQARRILASIHQALGEHEYAIEQGNRFLKVRPDNNEMRVLVAQSLIRLGKRDDALRELNKVPVDQRDDGVNFALGRVHANLGKVKEAREYLMLVLASSKHNQKVLRTLFKIDRDNEANFAETRELIVAAVEAMPDDGDLAQLHGMVMFTDGNLEAAEEGFVRATELNPDDIEAHQQLARFYSLTGRADETIATYERAVKRQPTSDKLHHFLALLYESQGEIDKAVAAYENAIKYNDNHAFAKNNLAYLLADSGRDLDRALDLAQDAKALLPNDANAADTLGWVLFKRGVSGAAVGYLKESVQTANEDDPGLGVMRHHLAQAYEADGNAVGATEVLKSAIEDLERQQSVERSQGRDPQSPPWESDVRGMLERLTAS
ncbi:MAG: tetratricopeptide (TPR) repeat protein [Myxococcota bacterium]|jgi:tetratricopeptide (TPR) repeat protein